MAERPMEHFTVDGVNIFEVTDAKARQDCSDLKDELYNTLVTDTASGSIASFPDGADNVPVKSLAVAIEPIQAGSGDPSPTNIRPISGHTQAVVTRTGKNLLAKPFVYYSSAPATLSNCFFIKAGQYIFHFDSISATSWRLGIRLMDKDGNFLSDSGHNPASGLYYNASVNVWLNGSNVTIKEIPLNIVDDCYIRIVFVNGDTSASTTVTGAQLELGNTATAYEPYQGQTVTIDLNGTIYGGTLDVTTGVLTVDTKELTINSSDGFELYSIGSNTTVFRKLNAVNENITENGEISNILKFHVSAYSAQDGRENTFVLGASKSLFIQMPNTVASTIAELNTFISSNPVTVVYKLATPQTIQLTAQEVRTLLAQNNVFADAGNVNVEYRADTKLYIQKVLNA